jgi:hypothetical protein
MNMDEYGGLPNFSEKYKSIKQSDINIKTDSKNKTKKNFEKKTRFISTDMSKVNIADVLSFIKTPEIKNNILNEFENLDIVSDI